VVTPEAFEKMIRKYAKDTLISEDIQACFDTISRQNNGYYITYSEFENVFTLNNPGRNVRMAVFPEAKKIEEERRIVTKILDWALKRKYSSEDAFERLVRSVSRD